ncbi:hypothetical protein AAV97_00190 [Acinetobacter sp. Ag2]|nr:hypothetical protein AAV97_00190 [Acinetobacter sp. Ag2]
MYVLAYRTEEFLSQELSAGIVDYSSSVTVEKSGKISFLIIFQSKLLAKDIKPGQKKSAL